MLILNCFFKTARNINSIKIRCLSDKSARLLAVGIDWAILPTAFIIPILVARIRNEERVLERDLKGYRDYLQRTRYRLLPGIW